MTNSREAFLSILSSADFEHSGYIVLQEYRREEESLRLKLRLDYRGSSPATFWNVHVKQSLHECLTSDWADRAYVGRDHPAFAPFRESECDVYFTKNELPAREVLGTVATACAMELGEWHPVTNFLNEDLGLLAGQCGPHGLLGRFPHSVARRILSQFSGLPIEPVLLNEMPSRYWDGGGWVEYSAQTEVFVFGGSFVIGEGFRFEETTT
jgi:hypothetical protein